MTFSIDSKSKTIAYNGPTVSATDMYTKMKTAMTDLYQWLELTDMYSTDGSKRLVKMGDDVWCWIIKNCEESEYERVGQFPISALVTPDVITVLLLRFERRK